MAQPKEIRIVIIRAKLPIMFRCLPAVSQFYAHAISVPSDTSFSSDDIHYARIPGGNCIEDEGTQKILKKILDKIKFIIYGSNKR